MTVALVLAGEADAGLCGQLAALGVRRVDVAERTGPGLLTVAAAARTASERVLICVGGHGPGGDPGQAARCGRHRGLYRGKRRAPGGRARWSRWW